jgi:two-component system phosphate regulon sensor histidine kinase PhoR
MRRPNLPFDRQILATLVMCLPGFAVLVGLMLFGVLGWLPALLGAVGLIVLSLPLVRLYLGDITAFSTFIARLSGADRPTEPPSFKLSVAMDELSRAATALHTSWQQQQQALSAASSASKRILDGLPDPLIAIDRSRRITHVNVAAEALFGGSARGRDLAAVTRQPQVLAAVDAALAGEKPTPIEFTHAIDRVETAHVVHAVPLPQAAGDGTIVLLAFHDVTARRRTERMRADFVANASHELKTPISALTGFIETLRGPARDDEEARARFLAIMDEQAQRMARLVNDLLSLSDIELREHTRPEDTVDIAAVLRSVLDMLELRARQKGVNLTLDIESDTSLVLGDRFELAQVFQNLVDNAIKYSRKDGAVRCLLQPGDLAGVAALRIAVIDQGEGIAEEHLPRLTERFYRVDDARSRKLGGTGLGLAIVKHIVNRHRGRLQIESVKGEGTTVAVTLPLAPPKAVLQDAAGDSRRSA